MPRSRAPKVEILLLEKDESLATSLLDETVGIGLNVSHFEVLREMLSHMEGSRSAAVILGPNCVADELEAVEHHPSVLRDRVPVLTFLDIEEGEGMTQRVSLPSPLPSGDLRRHLASVCHLRQEVMVLRHELDALKEQEQEFYELGGVIAHDLRSPLSIVLGYAGILAESKLPELEKSHVKCIKEASGKMLSFIDALETFNGIGSQDLEIEACEETLMSKVLDDLAPLTALHRCQMKKGEWVSFEGDKDLIGFLLRELIQNAIVHNQPETEVLVRCQLIDERRQTVVEMSKPLVVISVSDMGQGIPAEHLKSVFRPFFKLGGEGHGLGLGMAKRIVEFHGGTLSLHGNEAGGITVFATFPKNQKDRIASGD